MEANKILFITDRYLPSPSSNGACVSKIVNSYQIKENVYVLAFSFGETASIDSNVCYCHYTRKPSPGYNRIFGYCQDDGAVKALLSEACRMIEEKRINTVVCVYRPVECLLAGLKLKKKYKDICVIGYFLDNIHEWSTSSNLKDRILFFNQKRLLYKLNRSFDSIIALKYYKATFEKMLGTTKKVFYAGLPSLRKCKATVEENQDSDPKHIHIVYAGSFYEQCRRPDEILSFMYEVCAVLPEIKIHLYSWGCESLIDAAKERMGHNLDLCGRVTAEEAERAIHSADILLNVGNDMPYAVPGKLFEYFSTGKPIINFCYRRNDGATQDCEKYGNVFNIYSQSDNSVDDCVKFILNRHSVSWDVLQTTFYDSLPEYTANLIMEKGDKHV